MNEKETRGICFFSKTLDFERNSRYPEHVQLLCSICSK